MSRAEALAGAIVRRAGVALAAASIGFAVGYPAAFLASHGFNAAGWPPARPSAIEWLKLLSRLRVHALSDAYIQMACGRHEAFASGGVWEAVILVGAACSLAYLASRRLRPEAPGEALRALPDTALALLLLLVFATAV